MQFLLFDVKRRESRISQKRFADALQPGPGLVVLHLETPEYPPEPEPESQIWADVPDTWWLFGKGRQTTQNSEPKVKSNCGELAKKHQ
jgi:hypothetical protein